MARGRFTYTLDAKGRLAIPQAMRMELLAQSDRPPVLTNLVGASAIGVYSAQRWDAIEQRLEGMSQVQPEVQQVSRLLLSGAQECPFDAQGRVLVPAHLREYAELERDVVIAGVGSRIEIWNKARFERELATAKDRGTELARIAADLGL
ncbi:MAG TPA: division/cell wall cluster transcriptional repressor MraZ [Myxococcota bacterium]|nr:division/cell wall cluster transcriptional repressor MraZ [Myxococcota bacterium]